MSADEALEKLVSAQHGRAIDFVKFAETKNAALLTFCSVWIGSGIAMLRTEEILPAGYGLALRLTLPLLTVAALIALTSFLPRTLDSMLKRAEDKRNLLYFGDVARMDVDAFGRLLRERYLAEGGACSTTYVDDLVEQVAIQSRIALRKFRTFDVGAKLVIACFVIMALPAVVGLARNIICLAIRPHGVA